MELPPIKDQPNFTPPDYGWGHWLLVWIGVGIAVGLGLIFLTYILTRRRRMRAALPPAPPLANHVMALTLLEDLRPAAGTLAPSELAARVVEIIRAFLHRQFGVMARYSTAQEILALRGDAKRPPPAPAVRIFEDFLLHTEALNFGDRTMPESQASALIDEAVQVVRRSMDSVTRSGTTLPVSQQRPGKIAAGGMTVAAAAVSSAAPSPPPPLSSLSASALPADGELSTPARHAGSI